MHAVMRLKSKLADVIDYSDWVRKHQDIVMPMANDF
jgi:hypothetical protein